MSTTPKSDSEALPKPEDWEQTMADVKRLVEALQNLIPFTPPVDPKPEPEPKPRKFDAVDEGWLSKFTPQPDTMHKTLFGVFLELFLDKEDEMARENERVEIYRDSRRSLPSFADKLTLRLSVKIPALGEPIGTQELNRTKLCLSDGRARLEEHILTELWALDVIAEEQHGHAPEKYWCWTPPLGGKFSLCHIDNVGGHFWKNPGKSVPKGLATRETQIQCTGPSDFGALCLLQTPIQDSILKFRWIEFIMTQTGFLNYSELEYRTGFCFNKIHLASFLCFLGTFAGYWLSGAERASFSFRTESDRHYAQIHFRYFTLSDTLNDEVGADGLRCQRQRGQIASSDLGIAPVCFEEKRISIFGNLSLVRDYDEHMPSIYRVLILTEADADFPFGSGDLNKKKPKWMPGLGGTAAFQKAISITVVVWEKEWNKVLDQIDNCLRLQLDQTMVSKQMDKWMFDDDFSRSRLYFTTLQILRIFGECIRTVSADIRTLDDLFLTPSTGRFFWLPSPDELLALNSNWKSVTDQQKDAEERLLRRLLDKTEEVKSLRDGLFNASSLREAQQSTTMARQSTTMNRYVIIFTVVTVLYVPPSFVSTVFGMTIFQKSVEQTTREYKVTTAVVSLITYFVALLSAIAASVDWGLVKDEVLKRWKSGRENSPVKGNSDSAPVLAQATGSAPIPQKSKAGDTEKKPGLSNEQQQDLERGNGGAGKRKFWSLW